LFFKGKRFTKPGLYEIKSGLFIDFLKHKKTSDPTIPLFKVFAMTLKPWGTSSPEKINQLELGMFSVK